MLRYTYIARLVSYVISSPRHFTSLLMECLPYFQSPHNLILRSTFSRRYDLRPTTLATINSANQLHPPTTPAPCTAALPYSHQSAAPPTPPGLYTIYPPFQQQLPLLGQPCRWSQKPLRNVCTYTLFHMALYSTRLELSLLPQYEL